MITGDEVLTAALIDFGTTATINGGPATIAVIFSGNPTSVGGDMLEQLGPTAEVSAADAAAAGLVRGDELTIFAVDYAIRSIDPDGAGGLILALEPI